MMIKRFRGDTSIGRPSEKLSQDHLKTILLDLNQDLEWHYQDKANLDKYYKDKQAKIEFWIAHYRDQLKSEEST